MAAHVLYATLHGDYANHWLDNTRTQLVYYGQNKGRRDHLIKVGRHLAVREKARTPFILCGPVTRVDLMFPKTECTPAVYLLTVDRSYRRRMVPRGTNDKYYHQAVHRVLGGKLPTGQPQGIY